MADITMHLTANFYPPIPHDIQLAVQKIFDELVAEFDFEEVFDRTYTLPNGAEVTGYSMVEELRLHDALFWDPFVIDDDPELQYAESKEVSDQLSFWENE
jgi:hypothetical protein